MRYSVRRLAGADPKTERAYLNALINAAVIIPEFWPPHLRR